MREQTFEERKAQLEAEHEALVTRTNEPEDSHNGVFQRWKHPVLTAEHTPLSWRYDLDPATNPYLMERLGINAVFNPGAIFWNDRYLMIARVEGVDRKSFFAVAESENGVDGFRFWDRPVVMPETEDPDINVYDMRIVAHEDGHLYGLFCTERKDPAAPPPSSNFESKLWLGTDGRILALEVDSQMGLISYRPTVSSE